MTIPTEPIGSIPRPGWLIEAITTTDGTDPVLDAFYDEAVRDTIARFESTGSPVITDGEQRKYHNFWTYCVQGLSNTSPDGFKIPFSAGHVRRMLRLSAGPFRYKTSADSYLFIDLNNLALSRFSEDDRKRIGVHTCPGSDCDSTHSANVDYADLLPSLFQLMVGNFYIALAGEKDRSRVLKIIREHMKPDQRIFVGVVSSIDPRIESPEDVWDRVIEASQYIPVDRLGTCDDCGFSPFCDDTTTSRETAFEKIRARVAGTALASEILEGG